MSLKEENAVRAELKKLEDSTAALLQEAIRVTHESNGLEGVYRLLSDWVHAVSKPEFSHISMGATTTLNRLREQLDMASRGWTYQEAMLMKAVRSAKQDQKAQAVAKAGAENKKIAKAVSEKYRTEAIAKMNAVAKKTAKVTKPASRKS